MAPALFEMLKTKFWGSGFSILRIYIDKNNSKLKEKYKNHIEQHNSGIMNDRFPNSGFDLFVPSDVEIPGDSKSQMVSMGVKCEMLNESNISMAYYMYPRSSFSKTPLMLGNHVGVIDSGYRGFLMGAFRNLSQTPYKVEEGVRLLQICEPSLKPIYVEMVDESELSTTERGEGGFGSTGV